MSQRPQQSWHIWPGWSIISATDTLSFTLWFTGLHGTGKSALAHLVKRALALRGYKVEIIDNRTLSNWLQHELNIEGGLDEDQSHIPGYDAFVTHVCAILARNSVITITTSVSPYLEARRHARENIRHFIEVYLYCSSEQRPDRLRQQESRITVDDHLYQRPQEAELSIDTSHEAPEQSALRVMVYLEEHGYIVPLWEDISISGEVTTARARLHPLDYLE